MGTANERHIAGKCVCCACTDRRQAGDQLDYIHTVARRCHTCRPSYHPRPLSAVAYTRRAARPPSGTHYALDARRLLPTTTSPSRRAHVDNRRVNYDAWHRRACTVRRVPFRWRARVPGGRCRMLPTENVFREVLRCTHLLRVLCVARTINIELRRELSKCRIVLTVQIIDGKKWAWREQ